MWHTGSVANNEMWHTGSVANNEMWHTGSVANNYGMNEMQIVIRFIFRSDLTRIKQRVSLYSSLIINTKMAFLMDKDRLVYF